MYDLAIVWDWIAFSVRWLHVITAMAWIGASCPSSYKVGRQSGLSTGGSGSFV